MALSRRQVRIALVVGVVLGVALGPVVGHLLMATLSGSAPTSNTVPLETNSGLTVNVEGGANITLDTPFDNDNTVNLTTESGNATISSSGSAAVTIHKDDITGTWTNVTNMDVTSANVTIDPADKTKIGVGGDIDTIKIKETIPDDGKTDFIYSGTGGTGTVIVHNLTADQQYGLIDQDTGEALDIAVANSSGVAHFTDAPLSEHEVSVEELGELVIREETAPHDKINQTAEVTFYEDTTDDPVIKNFTTTDGTVDLTGLPVDSEFSVEIKIDGYHNRTILYEDLSQQNTAYLLNKSNTTTVENRFTVEDRTGNFPADRTELVIQRAINRSLFDSNADGYVWENVAGDDLGGDEAFTTDLEEEGRYRLVVKNEDGDQRILGSYTAETGGTINLIIGKAVIDPGKDDSPETLANRTNETGQPVQVTFELNDTRDETEKIWLHIYEYGNESNELLANTSFDAGPYGTFVHTENVPAAQNNTTWVVDYTVKETDGDVYSGTYIVGPKNPVLQEMPWWLVSMLSVGLIWTTAGLFSQLNGDVGAIVVAGLGAILYFVDFVPQETGGGVVVLALITAAIMFIRERQKGGGL